MKNTTLFTRAPTEPCVSVSGPKNSFRFFVNLVLPVHVFSLMEL